MRCGRMRNAKTANVRPESSRIGTIRKAIGTAANFCLVVGARNTVDPPAARETASATVITARSPTRWSMIRARMRPAGSKTTKPAFPSCDTAGFRIARRRACSGAALRASGSAPVRRARSIRRTTSSRTRGSLAISAARLDSDSSHCPRAETFETSIVRSDASSLVRKAPATAEYVQKPTPTTRGTASSGHTHVGSWGKRAFIGGAYRVSGLRAPPRETRRRSIRPGRAAEARRRPAYSRA